MLRAVSDPTPWFDHALAVLDLETTGLDAEHDRVIEIAIVEMSRGEEIHRYVRLVNPGREVSTEVTTITGITPEELADAPPFSELAAEIQARLEGRALVAYNLGFDRSFLHAEFERCGIRWEPRLCIDPLVFVRQLQRNQGSKRLGAVAARMGIELERAHRADADAEATGRVLYALRDQLPDGLDELLLLQSQWAQQQEQEMAGWRGRGGDAMDTGLAPISPDARGTALGPAYIYGDDTDPVRAMFAHLPDSGQRRG